MNSKGFSLIEIMIAVGLMSVISLGVMHFMENQTKSANTMETKMEANSFLMEFQNYLTKAGVCSNSLKGLTLPSDEEGEVEFDELKSPIGKTKYQTGKRFPSNIILEKMTLSNFEAENTAGDMGSMELTLHFRKPKMTYGNKIIKKKINIEVLKDDSGKILNCGPPGLMVLNPTISVEEIQKIVNENNGGSPATDEALANNTNPKDIDLEKQEVQKIIENNPYLKELKNAMKSLKENNAAAEEQMKKYLEADQ
ncbi:MAG: prepilin-type N-terminal cleavage/methylation domain-containing protein [Halobacteriovoraceae bacterium]|jgi:prepilin-type N-terminal cleavage/methylation domain-containing protein|nr:prepilin-type N-terminal cleavage/methylation domain-containing protein [Halobacteriovoraceae bacterium]MBT5094734.1 prepilin-type N-terminal cleavage/methylation domain-containing protein [Halobacteriovoraceae bacterium]